MLREPERTGTVLDGRYRLLQRLGQGGMGTVYLAEHLGLGQRRAIKFIHHDLTNSTSAVRRFLQEARIVSALQHPHVVSVFDVAEADGTAYYVMELLEGEDLRARLRREGTLPWPVVRELALQVCDALDAAHRQGIVHRDLKPENCFCVSRRDGALFLKILDFGIAKLAVDAEDARLTGTGEALGTVGYMAPEQLEGQTHPGVDVHALGVMIYELLAGRTPHIGSPMLVIGRIARGVEPPPLAELCPGLAPAIDEVVRRAIAFDPAARWPDMRAFAQALAEIPADVMGANKVAGAAPDASSPTIPRLDVHATTGLADPSHLPRPSPPPRSVNEPETPPINADLRLLLFVVLSSIAVLVGALLWLRKS